MEVVLPFGGTPSNTNSGYCVCSLLAPTYQGAKQVSTGNAILPGLVIGFVVATLGFKASGLLVKWRRYSAPWRVVHCDYKGILYWINCISRASGRALERLTFLFSHRGMREW